ncbi:conserved hypothetical protein [Burkholderia pseudomallei Pakistan 9]|nr:conserved hypothetical protein [Burkholderia pseudomallei 576]EEH28073.1 conserved hypothetical protein [Burkholderia pseudomallei Pakistan 9]
MALGARSHLPARASARDRHRRRVGGARHRLPADGARRPAAQGFVQRWVGRLLYHDLPAWAFTVAYVLFALLVWLTWRRIPARDK